KMEYSKSGFTLAMAACGALFMAACAGKKDSATKPFATAEVSGFAANTVSGSAVFTSADQSGVRIQGDFKGLSPNSKYAIHVHEKGSCETPDATGPHFDPSQSNMHGGPDATAGTHHAGDLPNLETDENGVAKLNFTSTALGAGSSDNSVLGRSIVIHAQS